MIRAVLILGLLVLGTAEDLLGVNYSFHVDFFRNFNRKKCNNESAWRLVSYEALNIEPLFANSVTGIRADKASCASSFPIVFFGGTLEINVYVRVISEEFKLSIEVFDDLDKPITSYQYGRRSETFGPGWNTIYIKIDKHTKGYIKLQGRSRDNEIVLIDSFKYVPSDTTVEQNKEDKRSVSIEEDEDEMIFNYQDHSQTELDEEGSGSGEEPEIEPSEEDDTFWTPVNIFLVSLGGVAGVAIIGVGGYQYGKVKALENIAPTILEEDFEPPRTITIPRATSTNETPRRFMRFD